MPNKIWKYTCCPKGETHWQGSAKCDDCGRRGVFDGWHYSSIELMCQYSERYGLKPIGPHRGLADQLFRGTTSRCPKCTGRGLITVAETDSFIGCPDCKGDGVVWKISLDEVKNLRKRVLKSFPDAEAGSGRVFPRTKEPHKKKKVAKTARTAAVSQKYQGGFFTPVKEITAERIGEMVEQLGGKKPTAAEIEETRKELAQLGLPKSKGNGAGGRSAARRRGKR